MQLMTIKEKLEAISITNKNKLLIGVKVLGKIQDTLCTHHINII